MSVSPSGTGHGNSSGPSNGSIPYQDDNDDDDTDDALPSMRKELKDLLAAVDMSKTQKLALLTLLKSQGDFAKGCFDFVEKMGGAEAARGFIASPVRAVFQSLVSTRP
jgi:hypothetical protein